MSLNLFFSAGGKNSHRLPTKILLSVEAQLYKLRDHQCTKLPHNPIGTKIYINPSETQFRVLLLDCLALYTLVRISRSYYINMSLPVPWVWYLFCPKEWFYRWKCFVLFYLDYLVNFNLLPGSIRCLFILQHHAASFHLTALRKRTTRMRQALLAELNSWCLQRIKHIGLKEALICASCHVTLNSAPDQVTCTCSWSSWPTSWS